MERGDVYFFYRPAEGVQDAHGLPDVQRFFAVLKPQDKDVYRALIVGQKKMPEPTETGERYWGFVDRVAHTPDELKDALRTGDNPGDRTPPAPRAAGAGAYAIVRHANHVDLAYVLGTPGEPGEAQRDLHIAPSASYSLSIKNPDVGAPAGFGLDPEERADFPDDLANRFGDHRWVAADPPEFLDHEGCEFLLIAGAEDTRDDLDVDLTPSHDAPELLEELGLERGARETVPLFEGAWA